MSGFGIPDWPGPQTEDPPELREPQKTGGLAIPDWPGKEPETALTRLPPPEEAEFQKDYAKIARKLDLDPDPDDPRHHYDYRAAWRAGEMDVGPQGHFPSPYKLPSHPNRFVGGVDTITGRPDVEASGEPIDTGTGGYYFEDPTGQRVYPHDPFVSMPGGEQIKQQMRANMGEVVFEKAWSAARSIESLPPYVANEGTKPEPQTFTERLKARGVDEETAKAYESFQRNATLAASEVIGRESEWMNNPVFETLVGGAAQAEPVYNVIAEAPRQFIDKGFLQPVEGGMRLVSSVFGAEPPPDLRLDTLLAQWGEQMGGMTAEQYFEERQKSLEDMGILGEASGAVGDVASWLAPFTVAGKVFRGGAKALGLLGNTGRGLVLGLPIGQRAAQVLQGMQRSVPTLGPLAGKLLKSGATLGGGLGVLTALRENYDPETGELTDAGQRLMLGVEAMAFWPAYEIFGMAGQRVAARILGRGKVTARHIVEETAEQGLEAMPGEDIVSSMRQRLGRWIGDGKLKGVVEPSKARRVIAETAQIVAEESGMSFLDAKFRESFAQFIFDGNIDAGVDALGRFLGNGLVVLGIKAGSFQRIPDTQRLDFNRRENFPDEQTGKLEQLGWRKDPETGEMRLDGETAGIQTGEGRVTIPPKLARRMKVESGTFEGEAAQQALEKVEFRTLQNHIDARRVLPGHEAETSGQTYLRPTLPENPATLVTWRFGKARTVDFLADDWKTTEIRKRPREYPDAEQHALGKELRNLADEMEDVVGPEAADALRSAGRLLMERRADTDPAVDNMVNLVRSGALGDAMTAAGMDPSRLRAVVKEALSVASGTIAPEHAARALYQQAGVEIPQEAPSAQRIRPEGETEALPDAPGERVGPEPQPAEPGQGAVPAAGQRPAQRRGAADAAPGRQEQPQATVEPDSPEFPAAIERAAERELGLPPDVAQQAPAQTPPETRELKAAAVRGEVLGPEAGAINTDLVIDATRAAASPVTTTAGAVKEAVDMATRFYAEPMADSMERFGSAEAKGFAESIRSAATHAHQVIGRQSAPLTEFLKKARAVAGKRGRAITEARELVWEGDAAESVLQQLVEGRYRGEVSPELAELAEGYADLRTRTGEEMEAVGAKIRVPGDEPGSYEWIDFTADPNRQRFIRMPTREYYDLKKGGDGYQKLVEILSERNGFTMDEAAFLVDESLNPSLMTRGAAEIARVLDYMPAAFRVKGKEIHVLETDPFALAQKLVRNTALRSGIIKELGQDLDGTEFPKLVRELTKLHGEEAGRMAQDMLRVGHGLPVRQSWFDPTSKLYALTKVFDAWTQLWRATKLTVSFIPNIPEFAGQPAEVVGQRRVWRSWIETLGLAVMTGATLGAHKGFMREVRRLADAGIITRDVVPRRLRPGRRLEDATRVLAGYITSPLRWVQEFNEVAVARAAVRMLESPKEGDRTSLESLGIPRAEVDAMIAGNANKKMVDRALARIISYAMGGTTALPIEKSRAELSRSFRRMFAFQNFWMARVNNLRKVTGGFLDAAKEGDTRRMALYGNRAFRMVFGTALSGSMAWALRGLFTGDMEDRIREAKEDPGEWAFQNILFNMLGGVTGSLIRTATDEDEKLTSLARMFTPYASLEPIYEMVFGTGRFEDIKVGEEPLQAAAIFGKAVAPIGRHLERGLFGFQALALAHRDQDLDRAMGAYYRWRFRNAPFGRHTGGVVQEDKVVFRRRMRKVRDLIKAGHQADSKDLREAVMGALRVKSFDDVSDIGASIRNLKVFAGADWRALTSEQQDAVRRFIGDKGVAKLEAYDDVLDELAGNGFLYEVWGELSPQEQEASIQRSVEQAEEEVQREIEEAERRYGR